MSKQPAVVVPIRRARSRKIDLPLALAMLSNGVKAHEAAIRRTRVAFLRRLTLRIVDSRFAPAKSLGA